MDELTLNCWLRSEDPEAIFQVKISKTDTVYNLQEAIKNKTLVTCDAYALPLYKPKHPLSEPHEDKLSQLILSEHTERLKGYYELSRYFPEQPPKYDIHIIVDATLKIICWLRRAAFIDSFQLRIHPGEYMDDLISRIYAQLNLSRSVVNHPIRLYKISGDENELQESLNKNGVGELLLGGPLALDFLGVPVLDPLRVIIEISVTGDGSPTIVQEPISHADGIQEYRDISLKVKNWGKFEESDIGRNHIQEASPDMIIPDFVTTFQCKLLKKPRHPFNESPLQIVAEYFEPYQVLTAEDLQEEVRYADPLEVAHIALWIASYDRQRSWQEGDPAKDYIMDTMLFAPFRYAKYREDTVLIDQPLPFDIIVTRDDGDGELRKFRPRSDCLVINSSLPRLLVEVNSTSQTSDRVRMLAKGAFIVRFANNFVNTFNREKNFVLCAFYVSANDGTATRHVLFQVPGHETVYYNEQHFLFHEQVGRVEFARHLYNLLCVQSDEDEAGKDAITKLCNKVKDSHMKSFHTEPSTDGAAGGGDRVGYEAQLRAHGYEVEPQVIVDDSGGIWEPLSKAPDHILTVYRPANSKRNFIAKKVRKGSNELDILKLLNTLRLKSDSSRWSIHVISLVDSFDGWAILPKMATLEGYLDSRPKVFESKVPQICLGLIKGLAYLHELRIAHRDIKPDNLVVDKNFTLQIIDFDLAVRVKDKDQEVNDQCGTKGWTAPEVGKSQYSPIKADRWSCGQVLLSLLDEFSKEDMSLMAFARDLVAHDPEQRPSLLEWVAPFEDSGNIGNSDASKASWLRRDQVEDDGETTKPPNMKKRRLDSG